MKKQRHLFPVVTNVRAGHGDHCHTDDDIHIGCHLAEIPQQTCDELLDIMHQVDLNHCCPTSDLVPCRS